MDRTEVYNKLRAFVINEMIRVPGYDLGDDEEMMQEGLVQSTDLALFGVYAEDEFDVYIPDPDLTVEKVGTLRKMVDRVMQGLE